MILGLAVFIGSHVFITMRAQRAARGRAPRRMALQGASCRHFARRHHPDRLRLRGLSRRGADRALDAAGLDAPPHRSAGVAGCDLRRGGLHPRRHRAHAQASDAGRRETLGGGASHRQWRSRRDHPVRFDPGLGGLRPHHAQASQRPGRAADPDRRADQRLHRVRGGHSPSICSLGLWFHPYVIGLRVFGA